GRRAAEAQVPMCSAVAMRAAALVRTRRESWALESRRRKALRARAVGERARLRRAQAGEPPVSRLRQVRAERWDAAQRVRAQEPSSPALVWSGAARALPR